MICCSEWQIVYFEWHFLQFYLPEKSMLIENYCIMTHASANGNRFATRTERRWLICIIIYNRGYENLSSCLQQNAVIAKWLSFGHWNMTSEYFEGTYNLYVLNCKRSILRVLIIETLCCIVTSESNIYYC